MGAAELPFVDEPQEDVRDEPATAACVAVVLVQASSMRSKRGRPPRSARRRRPVVTVERGYSMSLIAVTPSTRIVA
jgi:hypothetical protein